MHIWCGIKLFRISVNTKYLVVNVIRRLGRGTKLVLGRDQDTQCQVTGDGILIILLIRMPQYYYSRKNYQSYMEDISLRIHLIRQLLHKIPAKVNSFCRKKKLNISHQRHRHSNMGHSVKGRTLPNSFVLLIKLFFLLPGGRLKTKY